MDEMQRNAPNENEQVDQKKSYVFYQKKSYVDRFEEEHKGFHDMWNRTAQARCDQIMGVLAAPLPPYTGDSWVVDWYANLMISEDALCKAIKRFMPKLFEAAGSGVDLLNLEIALEELRKQYAK